MIKTYLSKTSIFHRHLPLFAYSESVSGGCNLKKDSYGSNRYNGKRTNHVGGYLHIRNQVKGYIVTASTKKTGLPYR